MQIQRATSVLALQPSDHRSVVINLPVVKGKTGPSQTLTGKLMIRIVGHSGTVKFEQAAQGRTSVPPISTHHASRERLRESQEHRPRALAYSKRSIDGDHRLEERSLFVAIVQ